MFVLIWATLLVSVRGISADTETQFNSNPSVEPSGTASVFTGSGSAEVMTSVNATAAPKILNGSGCTQMSKVLTCVCISGGFPLPAIKYPLLQNYTEYSVTTEVSNDIVKSTVILTIIDHGNTAVECVINNDGVDVRQNLTIVINHLKPQDLLTKLLITLKQPQVIIAFLTGILLSANICCWARTCHRKKRKRCVSLENLEMLTTHGVTLDGGSQVSEEGDRTRDREAGEGRAEAAGPSEPTEVQYSNIDFSVMNRRSPTEAREMQELTDTEYAEIKREATEPGQEGGNEDS